VEVNYARNVPPTMADSDVMYTFGPTPPTDAALGHMVEYFLGPVNPSNLSLHSFALANWYRFNHCMADPTFREELSSLLSDAQKRSYTLLFEWWTAAHQEPGATLYALFEIVSEAQDLEAVIDEDGWSWTDLLRFLQLREWPKKDVYKPQKVVANCHDYSDVMTELYFEEFCCARFTVDARLKRLRKDAAVAAYVQQAAFFCHHSLHLEGFPPQAHVESLTMGVSPEDTTTKVTDPTGDRIQNASASITAGPAVESCAWLDWKIGAAATKLDLPYYLWDAMESRTVTSSELVDVVPYTAISHTWGRWAEYEKPKVRVPGIPWPIYRNTQFDVAAIPEMLSRVPTSDPFDARGARYVWFDLACIPQEDHDPIKSREIARQARIFRCAVHAVAWFHDVDNFSTLQTILQWMLLQLFLVPVRRDSAREASLVTERFERLRLGSSNLLVPRKGPFRFDGRLGVPNGWFTSLWTLQELCLRPDMWVCSSDFRPFSIHESTAMPLNGLIAVYRAFTAQILSSLDPLWRNFDHEKQHHLALWEFDHWSQETGMDLLLDMRRTDVLALGDRRECTSRRAEAIMSVLGVTEWYAGASVDAGEKDMVLEKYPLEFVRELQQSISGEMFTGVSKFSAVDMRNLSETVHEPDPTDVHLATEWMGLRKAGSLLPFHRTAVEYVPTRSWAHEAHDELESHSAVQHWRVDTSGTIHIPSACILAASDTSVFVPEQVVPVQFFGFLMTAPSILAPVSGGREYIDLQKWIVTRPYVAFAVVVMFKRMPDECDNRRVDYVTGVLIGGLDRGSLRKIGSFVSEPFDQKIYLPTVTAVGWAVQ